MALMILKPNKVHWMTFSGHSDTELAIWVKNWKFDSIWARKVGVPCLNLANCPWSSFGWLETWTHPFTALFSAKFQISWLKEVVLCLNDQKKNKLDLHAFTRLQNHQNRVRRAGWYNWKGAFLKMPLMILMPNKVQWMIFYFFWSFTHWTSHFSQKLEIWLNLSQGGGGSLFEHGQLSMILFWLTWNMDPSLPRSLLQRVANKVCV